MNGELDALETGLEQAMSMLSSKGRCEVITFHSLEDRIVKKIFKNATDNGSDSIKGLVNLNQKEVLFKLVNKHPIVASDAELERNNRAHSAKLRIIEKI